MEEPVLKKLSESENRLIDTIREIGWGSIKCEVIVKESQPKLLKREFVKNGFICVQTVNLDKG